MESEDRLIEIFKRFETPKRRIIGKIGDDCAYISEKSGCLIALSVDTQIEGVHFKREWLSPFHIGYRAMASALSDLAAKGAKPLLALVDLHLSPNENEEFIYHLYKGMHALSMKFGFSIAGGNISKSKVFSLSITVAGEIKAGGVPKRSGARKGDYVYLTGDVGRCRLFLELVDREEIPEAVSLKFKSPMPRFKLMWSVFSQYKVTSSIDISDGLGKDAERLARASGVDIYIYENQVPLHPVLKRYGKNAVFAIESGEEYEVMFTSKDFIKKRDVTLIGEVRNGNGKAFLITHSGKKIEIGESGFDHFRQV